jgi:hypothetical protein
MREPCTKLIGQTRTGPRISLKGMKTELDPDAIEIETQ